MQQIEQITDKHFAEIGRVVATFSLLEHEIVRACIVLLGGPDFPEEDRSGMNEKILSIAKKGLKGKLDSFFKLYRTVQQEDEWLLNLESEKEYLIRLRDIYAHAIWDVENDKLRGKFFSRIAIQSGKTNDEILMSLSESRNLSITNIELANQIIARFDTELPSN
jgi:hypothetical protein